MILPHPWEYSYLFLVWQKMDQTIRILVHNWDFLASTRLNRNRISFEAEVSYLLQRNLMHLPDKIPVILSRRQTGLWLRLRWCCLLWVVLFLSVCRLRGFFRTCWKYTNSRALNSPRKNFFGCPKMVQMESLRHDLFPTRSAPFSLEGQVVSALFESVYPAVVNFALWNVSTHVDTNYAVYQMRKHPSRLAAILCTFFPREGRGRGRGWGGVLVSGSLSTTVGFFLHTKLGIQFPHVLLLFWTPALWRTNLSNIMTRKLYVSSIFCFGTVEPRPFDPWGNSTKNLE